MDELQKLDRDVSPRQEETAATPAPRKTRQAYSKVRRELNEEELLNPAVHRLLVNELDRMEEEVADHRHFRDDFYKCDKECAVLRGARTQHLAVQIVKDVCFVTGGALAGIGPSLWHSPPYGLVVVLVAFVLIICGIVCRIIEK